MTGGVVLLNRWFAPEIFGGTETTIQSLGTALRTLGSPVTAVCETRALPAGWDVVDEMPVFRHPGRTVPSRLWSLQPAGTYLNVVRWLRTLAPDLAGRPIIARAPLYAAAARAAFPDAWITYWAPGSRPWFGLFQGREDLSRKDRWWQWVDERQNHWIRMRALRGANMVIAEASHVAHDIEHRLGIRPERIRTRRNGVDCQRFRPRPFDAALGEELRVHPGTPVIVAAARLEPMKNLAFLLRAFAHVRQDAVLVMVGDGSERERLVALAAELRLSDRVRFPGWRADVERFYALATAYVLPSVYEPYGNAFSEALASGAPTIGLRPSPRVLAASADHIIDGTNGYLVDEGDIAGLAGRL